MAFFIFSKLENMTGTLYKIAKTQSDLDNLNITNSVYKILTDSDSNFNAVNLGTKIATSWTGNTINYRDLEYIDFGSKEIMQKNIDNRIKLIDAFLLNNQNHVEFQKWNDYKALLQGLNLDSIVFPYENNTIEMYIQSLSLTPISTLQLP